jgi:hypothetical protein
MANEEAQKKELNKRLFFNGKVFLLIESKRNRDANFLLLTSTIIAN